MKNNTLKQIIFSTIFSLIAVAPAHALMVADGWYDPTEGYTSSKEFSINLKDDTTTDKGTVRTGTQNNSLFVYAELPFSVVDNYYGTNTTPGYPPGKGGKGKGKDTTPTSGKGKGKGGTTTPPKDSNYDKGSCGNNSGCDPNAALYSNHTFEHLVKSDSADFVLTDGSGNTVLEVTIDYIEETSVDDEYLPEIKSAFLFGNEITNPQDVIKAYGTSLDYNFNHLNYLPGLDSPDISDPNWLGLVGYELEIDMGIFADFGFGEVLVPSVHISPHKSHWDKVCQPNPVPEPATALLFFSGILGAYVNRRRS